MTEAPERALTALEQMFALVEQESIGNRALRAAIYHVRANRLLELRNASLALEVVGKRFNAFAAGQWLSADGDGRDPAQARSADAPCDRLGCVADLPEGESLSIVLDRLAFDEDCARAEIVVSALSAPQGCKAKFVLDEKALARFGAVGLTWSDDTGFTLAERPQPARKPSLVARARARARRPAHSPRPCGLARGPDPADPPAEGR